MRGSQAALQSNFARPEDQATRLRELVSQNGRHSKTLAVISGKGGVGKTNVAVNVSICLAVRGQRVVLVDLDMGLANADLLLGLTPKFTLAQMISGARTLREVILVGPAGIGFVPGASGLADLANLSEFERQSVLMQLKTLDANTDIVVSDCGAGISKGVMRFAQSAQSVMVVTTPEPTAVTDAYAAIKTLARDHFTGRVGLLVNKAADRVEAEATFARISEVAKKFLNYSVANFGFVLQDTAVVQAVRARSPVVLRSPRSIASTCFAAVADSMIVEPARQSHRGGFFQRVAALFI